MARIVLHSDLNSFYASVETVLDPTLRGKAVAVCGSTEDRHGIVLAKSDLARKAGVKTGMANWEAQRCCPGLLILHPQYEQYVKYSRLAREIYQRYTDRVEPYGMDECWLDLTGCRCVDGLAVADEIRKTVHEELGLTVSIGVSFNKIFAKLGSDMKKPDAVTVISEENYKEKVWPLPASELIYVGPATTRKLATYGIHTIGQLAAAPPEFLKQRLGVNGVAIWRYAAGLDTSRVMHQDYDVPIKSIGHGITCVQDLLNSEEVWRVMLMLSQDIGHKLRANDFNAGGVQITVKDNALGWRQYQAPLEVPTQLPLEIARRARALFDKQYDWRLPVRAVTVRAIKLSPKSQPVQMLLYDDPVRREKRERLEDAVEDIRSRFGKSAIYSACLMGNLKMPGLGVHEVNLPGMMFQ
ncbi:DNA polymerase-4 [Sporobacter termitidis DSM 10068]|uniref:DNA polymerase IV n=1 Tax=Sporobacter termitidis DSM 10068 TaxID=1123282 RepID=A0A1M5YNF9_9FIRM|nr:DNA polymerase IV [Sporobacter termitidis]SHI13627.1 DNA polymerase-4 [Sporobacter termitidis DSM 10068]